MIIIGIFFKQKTKINISDDLQIRSEESENMFGSKTIHFTLFSSKRLNIYQGNPKLDLIVHSVDELESWKASFLRAGVYPEVECYHGKG